MKCGMCDSKEGETLVENFDPVPDTCIVPYPKERCLCYICTGVRCEDCQQIWGRYLSRLTPHKVPKRREAVLATRAKL